MPDDPNWPRASAWLGGEGASSGPTLAVVGAPVRFGSISGGRFDRTPAAIREMLARFSTWDGNVDIGTVGVSDRGDLDLAEKQVADAAGEIEHLLQGEIVPDAWAILGGDNSVTLGGVRGVGLMNTPGLITLDAHHDLRDTTHGLNNGNPVRALLEDGLPGPSVWQIGIQPFANSPAYAAVAREHGIHVVTADEVRSRGIEAWLAEALDDLAARCSAIYVDLDVDVLDRAFAPACPGSRPGGLMPNDLFEAARLAGAHPKVQAVDIVEVDPTRDVADMTVMTAARCLLSFAAGLATRR